MAVLMVGRLCPVASKTVVYSYREGFTLSFGLRWGGTRVNRRRSADNFRTRVKVVA